jgi:sugar phosphate isomerase/epimerase
MHRKEFLKLSAIGATATVGLPFFLQACSSDTPVTTSDKLFFKLSLAQWSLHKSIFGASIEKGWDYMNQLRQTDPQAVFQGSVKPLDFPRIARQEFGFDAIEYVTIFYPETTGASDAHIKQLKETSDQEGVRNVLMMVDQEGALGDPDDQARQQAVENHYKWVECAAFLGCHSIRVNAQSQGTWDEQHDLAADGLRRLSEHARASGINIIVENHGGLSSNAEWLSSVIASVGMDNCGTLPDYGNFRISETETFDTYKGMELLMPYAKGVSAKSYDFGPDGEETRLDYQRILNIVKEAGYTSYIGVEFEGSRLSEADGIRATRDLLIKHGAK